MKTIQLIQASLFLALLASSIPGKTADIDIYTSLSGTSTNPNILVILDNSSNWAANNQGWPVGKQGESELTALSTVIGELGDNVNLGLMMFNSGAIDGGYIRYHVRPMNCDNKKAFQELLDSPNSSMTISSSTNSSTTVTSAALFCTVRVGMTVTGSGIPANTTVTTATSASSITLSRAATATAITNLTFTHPTCTNGSNSQNFTPNCIYANFQTPGEKVNSSSIDYGAAMFEAFKYFGGYTSPTLAQSGVNGTPGTPQDSSHFGPMRYATLAANTDRFAYTDFVDSPRSATTYNPPINSNSCAKNYIVFIGNGYPNSPGSASLLTGVGGDATQIFVPDFTTISGVSQTWIASGVYATQLQCESAATAASAVNGSYDSYTCSNSVVSTGNTTTSCGDFGSLSACVSGAPARLPGYSSYSCAVASSSCNVPGSLGTSACGAYTTEAACQSAEAARNPSYSSVVCALSSSTCPSGTTNLGTTACGLYNSASACQTGAATTYPGYASYTCSNAGSCTANLTTSTCYSTSAACVTAKQAIYPGYNSITCGSAVTCPPKTTTKCAASNAYNNATKCNNTFTGAPFILGSTHATYTCTNTLVACPTGNVIWNISGSNPGFQYTTTGTGTLWAVSGTNSGGPRYDITGTGGGNTYTITGTKTTWDIYGNRNTTTVTPTGTRTATSANYADEWARFLASTDVNSASSVQSIRTYAIDVYKNQQDANQTALLRSMATNGLGKYFAATDEAAIVDALRKIVYEIQAVNSVFASSSLPVSVNAQGTFLNQIFMGMFRPDPDGQPRWQGNLKQYQFALHSGNLILADSAGKDAISAAGTGFISPSAISFWTSKDTTVAPDSTGGFWKNQLRGAGGGYDAPDGELVEKGGAAQMLRKDNLINDYTAGPGTSTNPRKLYTHCPSGSSCTVPQLSDSANVFDTSNSAITTALLGASSSTDRDNITKWVRGFDNNADEVGPGGSINVRPSIHADVLHSRPVVINYGGTTGVVVYYGTNDGVFHAVSGKQTGTGAGSELWGFVPSEFFSKLKRQRNNSPLLLYPNTPSGITPAPTLKDYAVDGSTGLYQLINADGTTNTAYIYLAMRRGGRFIYALDVTTPTNPLALWKKSNADSGFSELGQTWSQPKVTKIKGYCGSSACSSSNPPAPVLIFGAGYDAAAEDAEPPTANTMGRGIFILDAATGALVWSAKYGTSSACSGTPTVCTVAGMNYSIPADITLMDRNLDGTTDRLYAADVGGNVWRVDLEKTGTSTSTPSTWQVTHLAALGCASGPCSAGTNPRKFFYPAEVINTLAYDAVFAGSGDREHPLYTSASNGVTNNFFMLKDLHTDNNAASPVYATITQGATAPDGLFNATSTTYDGSRRGYYLTLAAGEKVVNAPITTAGYVYFGTNRPTAPSANTCTNLGEAKGYKVKPFTGEDTSTIYDGGGLPPTAVSGIVNIVDSVTGDTTQAAFCMSCGGGSSVDDGNDHNCGRSASQGCKPEISVSTTRNRTYWFIDNK